MHPEEDISLEELKARKYQHLADRSGPVQFNFSMKPQTDDIPPQNNYAPPMSNAAQGAFGECEILNAGAHSFFKIGKKLNCYKVLQNFFGIFGLL